MDDTSATQTRIEGFSLISGYALPEPLSREDTIEALRKMKTGAAKAREELVLHNLRLVSATMSRMGLFKRPDVDDVFQRGTIGLIKAVNTYKEDTNTAFSTYATVCIQREYLSMFTEEKRLVATLSLDAPAYTDNDPHEVTLGDLIASDENVEESITNDSMLDFAKEKMDQVLTQLDRDIITMHYGLDGNPPMTHLAIAKQLGGISRQGVERRESRAIIRLQRAIAHQPCFSI